MYSKVLLLVASSAIRQGVAIDIRGTSDTKIAGFSSLSFALNTSASASRV